MAAKPTRRQRGTVKKTATRKNPAKLAPKKGAKTPKVVEQPPHVIPNVWGLTKLATEVLWRHKKVFLGIVALYGLLNIIFVSGLGANVDVAAVRNGFSSRLLGGVAAYTQLIGSAGSGTSQGASVYQMVLFLIVSLALVWALRQAYANQPFRVRDAYYKGMSPLIPSVLVVLLMLVQLLPAIIGLAIYQLVIANGIAASAAEIIFWSLALLALGLLSLYFIAASLQAFYIATLPDMTPVPALRTARQLVKGRRWLVLRKMLFLPLVLVLVTAIILLPIIAVVPVLAQFILLVIGPLLVALGHSYLYALYRELIHD